MLAEKSRGISKFAGRGDTRLGSPLVPIGSPLVSGRFGYIQISVEVLLLDEPQNGRSWIVVPVFKSLARIASDRLTE